MSNIYMINDCPPMLDGRPGGRGLALPGIHRSGGLAARSIIYIYIYTHIDVCMCIYIYIYVYT